MVTHEVIVRYSLSDIAIDVFSFVQICVQDKCAKLEKAKARALFKKALQSLGEEEEEVYEEEGEEVSFFGVEEEREAVVSCHRV